MNNHENISSRDDLLNLFKNLSEEIKQKKISPSFFKEEEKLIKQLDDKHKLEQLSIKMTDSKFKQKFNI